MNKNPQEDREFRRKQNRLQIGGLALGLVAAWIVGSLLPALPQRFTWMTVMLWSAALGASLFGWQSYERAGKALTRSGNRWLNTAVGAGIPFGALLLLGWLLGGRA